MMMKIIGAALIVSGSYLIGLMRVRQRKRRLTALRAVQALVAKFDRDLRTQRSAPEESLRGEGAVAEALLRGAPVEGLDREDEARIQEALLQIRTGAYTTSVAACGDLLAALTRSAEALESELATSGKALPLVTGTAGFLLAVFLF